MSHGGAAWGLPQTVAGVTVDRLCGSGLDAAAIAARAIASGEAELLIAGAEESMSGRPSSYRRRLFAFGREVELYDTTMGGAS
jgi:acetyl-CoA acyltransferase